MDNGKHLIIFAHARTGSTSLMHLLSLHTNISICHEPFHPSHSSWYQGSDNYLERICDRDSLDRELLKIFERYNGIKTLTYQLPENLYEHLLLRDDTIVISLTRRNLLQAAVSGLVAQQTKIWQKSDIDKTRSGAVTHLDPLPIEELRQTISYMYELDSTYSEILAKKPSSSVLKLTYEDLFSTSLKSNRDVLKGVFEFLKLEMPGSDTVDTLLDPAKTKVTSNDTYQMIPNALEINRELGSENLGWLFPLSSP